MTRSGVEPVPRLVLDTSAYSRLRSGDARVVDVIAAAETVFVPVTVLGELHGAFETGSRPRENRLMLATFLAESFVTVLHVDASVARQYGRIYARLRRAGTPIPTNDMWIAAATVDSGGSLLTFDAHFHKVQGLDRIVLEASSPQT